MGFFFYFFFKRKKMLYNSSIRRIAPLNLSSSIDQISYELDATMNGFLFVGRCIWFCYRSGVSLICSWVCIGSETVSKNCQF